MGAMTTIAAPGTTVDRSPIDPAGRVLLAERLHEAVRGEVEFGSAFRAVYATDSSNYRQIPLGVVFPMDAADVSAAVRVCAAAGAPVLGRGAGTGLAGQTVNVAVVLDFSRHMNKILDIDPERRIARVQPGVVLDDLRAACEPFGLTFGPDPATHAWCTLGGMIGNNSCGTHALYAGKTVDNVARLRIVTAAGEDLWVGEYDDAGYAAAVADGGTLARLLGGLRETGRRYRSAVDAAFPDIPRRVSGYNLDQVLPGRPLHLARLLVGSESTLALTVEAELALSTSPRHRHLVVLGYPDIFVAADAVPSLVAFGLLGLEGMDDTLVGQSAAIGLNTDGIALLPPGRGWLLAEIGDDDPEVAERRTVEFLAGLPESVNARRIDDPVQVKQIWSVRESGLAATALPPGKPPNHEGWEDAAVPPERLGEYLRRITALWDHYGYYGAWYGHFGQGCVHTRNPFDLHTVSGLATFRAFLTDAADVVAELGGSISGEHGDGQARGELLARMFGPDVIEAFRTVKSLFDPAGLLNPGKLVDPYPLDTNLRYGPAYRQARQATDTSFALARDGGSLQLAAERCVGVGRCRRDDTGVMCPSYRATRDERHSTRGRAKMLVEMFTGEVTDRSWRNNDVHDALELCLSCKGCAVDCPTGVDMATYKAEFNSHYYARRLRPRVMYALGLLPWVSRVATRIPRTSSAGALEMHGASVRCCTQGRRGDHRSADTSVRPKTVPAHRDRPASAAACDCHGGAVAGHVHRRVRPRTRPGRRGRAVRRRRDRAHPVAVGVLRSDAVRPWHARSGPAIATARAGDPRPIPLPRHPGGGTGTVVPGSVPRRAAGPASRRSAGPRTRRTGPLVVGTPDRIRWPGSACRHNVPRIRRGRAVGRPVVVHPHCHGRATVGTAPDETVLRALGYRPTTLDAGCCGLAGSFGYAAETAAVSRTIATDHWLPRSHDPSAVENRLAKIPALRDGRVFMHHPAGPARRPVARHRCVVDPASDSPDLVDCCRTYRRASTSIRSSMVAGTDSTVASMPARARDSRTASGAASATRTARPSRITGSPAAFNTANAAAQSRACTATAVVEPTMSATLPCATSCPAAISRSRSHCWASCM